MLVVFKNTPLYNHQTTRWELVKNSVSPKRPFFCVFRAILPIFRHFHSKSWATIQPYIFYTYFFLSFKTHPPLFQRGGGAFSTYLFILGHAHIWAQNGGGGMRLKYPLDPPMLSTVPPSFSSDQFSVLLR